VSTDTATPGTLPKLPAAIFGALVVVGAVTLVFGAASSDSELANRTYRVFLHNWLLWAVLSNGALVLSAAMRLTNGKWQGPIQRVADSMGAYVPASLLLFSVIYFGRHHLFEWTEHPIHGKEFWFEPTRLRATIALPGSPSSRCSTSTCRSGRCLPGARNRDRLRAAIYSAGPRAGGEARARARRRRAQAGRARPLYAICYR
jgi:hypothetical protein